MNLTPHEIKTVKDLLMDQWTQLDWQAKDPTTSPIRKKNLIRKAEITKALHGKFEQIK